MAKRLFYVTKFGTRLEVEGALIVVSEAGEKDIPLVKFEVSEDANGNGTLDISYPKFEEEGKEDTKKLLPESIDLGDSV